MKLSTPLALVASASLGLSVGCGSNGNGNGSGNGGGDGPDFSGTYTGSLTSVLTVDGMESSPDTVSVSWVLSQNGTDVTIGFPGCPGFSGTASGDVINADYTACPESNGVSVTYTGGTLTLDGNSLVVSLTSSDSGDGISGTGTLQGTLSK
jgi:hypothetical protein